MRGPTLGVAAVDGGQQTALRSGISGESQGRAMCMEFFLVVYVTFFTCMGILPVCMSGSYVCTVSMRPKEGTRSPRLALDHCVLSCKAGN